MNPLLLWLTSPEWAQVVAALLHSLWQGALLAAGLALVLRRLTHPAARYRCALAALGLLLLANLVTWALLNSPRTTNLAVPAQTISEPAPLPARNLNLNPLPPITVMAELATPPPRSHWTAWLALGWLLGALLMLVRASVKVAGAEQLRRSSRPLADETMNRLVQGTSRALGLGRKIRVAITDQLTSPAVVGVLVPTLILPLSLFTTLTPEQIRFVLLHELAHIRRGDYLANLFQLFAEALWFFNPAVWWISQQIRREREACCDALAIELSGAPGDYATTLVQVAEKILQPAPAAAPAFGDAGREPSSLADRVQRLLVPGYRPALRLTWRAMLSSLLIGITLLIISAFGTRNTVGAIIAASNATPLPARVTTNLTTTGILTTAEFKEILASIENRAGMELTNTSSIKTLPERQAQLGSSLTKQNTTDQIPALTESVGYDLTTAATFVSTAVTGTGQSSSSANMDRSEKLLHSLNSNHHENQSGSSIKAALATRTFAVGPIELAKALGYTGPLTVTNTAEMVSACLAQAGVDLQPPKSVFFKDPLSLLLVRATPPELDAFEKFLARTNQAAASASSTGKASARSTPDSSFPSSTNLHTRTFAVDMNALVQAVTQRLGTNAFSPDKPNATKWPVVLRQLFASVGANLELPESLYLNDRKGELFVRASLTDLEAIETLLQVLNYQTPQVNIKVRWIEIPMNSDLVAFAQPTNAATLPGPRKQELVGILSESQTDEILRRVRQQKGSALISEGQVTTLSTRQAQLQVSEIKTIVTSIRPEALKSPGISATNSMDASGLNAEVVPLGPVLGVLPIVSADQNQISLHVEATTKEFLGYDKKAPEVRVFIDGKEKKTILPLPRYRERQMTNDCMLRDGQTLVLGHLPTTEIATQPDGTIQRSDVTTTKTNNLYVLVTATLIDPAGNRFNPRK